MNEIKYLAALVTALALAACGDFERANAKLTGYSKILVSDVNNFDFEDFGKKPHKYYW